MFGKLLNVSFQFNLGQSQEKSQSNSSFYGFPVTGFSINIPNSESKLKIGLSMVYGYNTSVNKTITMIGAQDFSG